MRYRFDSVRGRSNGRRRSQADIQLLEYLAKVSIKYRVDSDEFFKSLLTVYQHGKCECGELAIECRLRGQNHSIFLITKGRDVVGQFSISEQFLNEEVNSLKEFVCRLLTMRTLSQGTKSSDVKIRDLKIGMKRLNINARVLRVSQPTRTPTGSGLFTILADALIADETGTINLSLFGPQIKAVTVHDFIQINNAYVTWFRGERQLRVRKHGKISVMNSTTNNIKVARSD